MVANPSSYERSDYVEVHLASLGVPDNLDERSLKLSRIWSQGAEEIPYQLDCPSGSDLRDRVMTFHSRSTPPGPNDYSKPTAEFLLEQGTPRTFSPAPSVWIEYYSDSGLQRTRPEGQVVKGVKIDNAALQAYFSLVPRPDYHSTVNYTGAATSIMHHRAKGMIGHGEVLSPLFFPCKEQARWGQITRLDFYTLPWERRAYQSESMLERAGQELAYELVWSRCGPLQASISLKSSPFQIRYMGFPFFAEPKEVVLNAHLLRTITFW